MNTGKAIKITNIGFCLLIDEQEYFVPFAEYPLFKEATVSQIYDYSMLSPTQLYWPTLDCDIELAALSNPERFPLVFS